MTGPPRCGKTTALERTVDRLREDGHAVGGIVSPEIREEGDRVGFDVVDLADGERAVMAHVDYDSGPTVGKYRVDVGAVDRIVRRALREGSEDADCVVIDEVAPMQTASDGFIEATRGVLDAPVPTLAAIKESSGRGFVGEVKARDDVETFVVTPETRDELPDRLAAWVRDRI